MVKAAYAHSRILNREWRPEKVKGYLKDLRKKKKKKGQPVHGREKGRNILSREDQQKERKSRRDFLERWKDLPRIRGATPKN